MKDHPLYRKNILVGVSGSIAAYKSCEIVRQLKKRESDVRVVMSKSACEFVGPLTFQTLSQNKVMTDMFGEQDEWVPEHISIANWADALLIAPATANILGKARCGVADDLLSTTILSVKCPIIFAPAMNEKMYDNSVVLENIENLKMRGNFFIGPEKGFLAEGYSGKGRLAKIEAIVDFISSVIEEK